MFRQLISVHFDNLKSFFLGEIRGFVEADGDLFTIEAE